MVTRNKILTAEELKTRVRKWKDQGFKVVFTNGCFDILHLGHIDYLEKSRQQGDKLVIGLNTDKSVSRLKGQGRPVQNEETRARILAALEFVDAVTYFDQQTPYELIKTIVPDILVKGKDYKIEEIVGYDIVTANGGKVVTIDLVDGYSTTEIIEKIRKLNL
ncbi:D-glycero-beta-D-manno-heptose 1-phosphate adenylyltransferase [Bacteroidota bacterium]